MSTLWLLWVGLTALLLMSAAINISLRSRTFLSVAHRLEEMGRDDDLRWLTKVRERLGVSAATLRTATSLGILLACVEICELWGLASAWRDAVAFGIAFLSILIFGVAVPSALGKHLAGPLILSALPLLRTFHAIAGPFLFWVDAVDTIVRRLSGVPERTPEIEADHVEREILSVVSEGELQGAVDGQEKEMIQSVMAFGDTEASEIMTPRTDFVAIKADTTLADIKKIIAKHGHSRIPVYDETIDNILGVLYIKDLLIQPESEQFNLKKMLRTVPFVPHDKPVDDLLQEFRDEKVHMAIVLDEYGGTMGLVTIEDILEELVGEIEDEFEDSEPSPVERIDEQTADVDARMHIDDVNDALNIDLPEDDDYDTLGGFVFSTLGRIPLVGERCNHGNICISVIDAEPRRINRLRVHVAVESTETNETAGDNGDGQ